MEKKDKLFRSASGKTIRVATLEGHVVLVSKDWVKVPVFLHDECYRHGCVSNDMDVFHANVEDPVIAAKAREADMVKDDSLELIREWIEKKDADKFTAKGNPSAIELTKHIGVRVTTRQAASFMELLRGEGLTPPPKGAKTNDTNTASNAS